MKVINQVDQKFILCRLEKNSTTIFGEKQRRVTLIMIDQHAADERIRLENLWRQVFFGEESLESEDLERMEVVPPIQLSFHSKDRLFLILNRVAFQIWGIEFVEELSSFSDKISPYFGAASTSLPSPSFSSSQPNLNLDLTSQAHLLSRTSSPSNSHSHPHFNVQSQSGTSIYITTLPRILSDRLIADKHLISDLILKHLSTLSVSMPTSSLPHFDPSLSFSDHPIRRHRHNCPSVFLSLLDSKACRSAIMFGDVLSQSQSRTLIKSLSQTLFPYICAHGRPSMVPFFVFEEKID